MNPIPLHERTENPYSTRDFRQVVETRRDPKTGVLRNIFHSSKSSSLSGSLWDCSWSQRSLQWAEACIGTYRNLPMMPTPVSPSEMAKRWGCSHTWARKLILGSWDWIGVSARHYVHSSWVNEAGWIWKACIESPNPMSNLVAVNRLKEYVPDQDDRRPAGAKSIGDWLGHSSFTRLRAIGVLHACPSLRDRHNMYYVPKK